MPRDEQFYRLIADAITDYGVIQFDPNNKIVDWNTGAERLLGFSREEILGQSGAVFFTPEDREQGAPESELRIALRDGRAFDERWHMKKDQSRFWGSGVTTPVWEPDGSLRGFVKVVRDETERHTLLQRLQDSEQRLQLAQTIAGVGTWEWTVAGDHCVWSESMGLLFGLPAGTSLGSVAEFLKRVHEGDRETVLASLSRCLREGDSYEIRFRIRWPDESVHWLLATGRPFRNSEGRVERLLGVALDVTERKKGEEAALQQQEQLKHRVQTTGEALDRTKEELRALAASLLTAQEEERRRIARELHDGLGQQLAGLQMKLELLRQASSSLAEPLGAAVEQVALMSDELRQLSHRLHPSVLELIGLEAALRSLCEEWERTFDLPVRCTCSGVARPVPIEISSGLYRIAQEALHNVHKHAGDARVVVALSGDERQLSLLISDDGSGFDQTAVRRNRGLGMISMGERAALLGGVLEVKSQPTQGTTLLVRVPWP